MTCFPWKWEASCTISASRGQSKSFDSTTLSPTACVVGHLMRYDQLRTILYLHLKKFAVINCPCLFCATTEQHYPGRDLPVDQPQGNGVAAICGPRRIRAEPERQRRAWGPDGETAELPVAKENRNSLLDTSTPPSHGPLLNESFICRFWSRGSMWRRWRYCWIFPPTRRCCAATWPHILACLLVLRRSTANKSVWKTQTTLCSLQPPKSR